MNFVVQLIFAILLTLCACFAWMNVGRLYGRGHGVSVDSKGALHIDRLDPGEGVSFGLECDVATGECRPVNPTRIPAGGAQ